MSDIKTHELGVSVKRGSSILSMRLSCARSSSGLRSGFCLHLRKDRTSEQELQIPLWSQRHAAAFRTPGDPHGQTHGGPSERAHRGCAKSLASAHHTLSSCPGWRARLVTCPRCHVLESRFSQTVNGAQSRTCHPAPHTQASRGLQSVPGATSPQTAAVAPPPRGLTGLRTRSLEGHQSRPRRTVAQKPPRGWCPARLAPVHTPHACSPHAQHTGSKQLRG